VSIASVVFALAVATIAAPVFAAIPAAFIGWNRYRRATR